MLPEVEVELYGTLAAMAGGEKKVRVEARTLRDVYDGLRKQYPQMAEQLATNVSVSIDGRIYTEALFEEVGPENEIVLLPRISGG